MWPKATNVLEEFARWACAPHFFDWGGEGAMVCLCPPLLTPHFHYFPLGNFLVDNFNKRIQMAVIK